MKKAQVLTSKLFQKLVLRYLNYCESYLKSGLPETSFNQNYCKYKLNQLMLKVGIMPEIFWTKFNTLIDSNLLEINKFTQSRKTKFYVKIH